MKTKPRLAEDHLERLLKAGLPARWAAFDEVYGRSGGLREACERAGLAYVAIIPCDFRVTLPSGVVIKAEDAVGTPCSSSARAEPGPGDPASATGP